MAVDLATGIVWYESGSVRFAGTQAVGICFEDGMQAIYRRYKTYFPPQLEERMNLIGRIWVGLFLAWTIPVWASPVLLRGQGREILTMYASINGIAGALG